MWCQSYESCCEHTQTYGLHKWSNSVVALASNLTFYQLVGWSKTLIHSWKDKIFSLDWHEILYKHNEILVRLYFPSINFVKNCMDKYLQNWWHTGTTDILVTATDLSQKHRTQQPWKTWYTVYLDCFTPMDLQEITSTISSSV